MKVGVDRLNGHQDNRKHCKERQTILDWLTTIESKPMGAVLLGSMYAAF